MTMKIKKHASDFINSDYGNIGDVKLVKEEHFHDKHVFIYKVLNNNIKMHEGCNRYMGSFYLMDKWYSIIKYYKDTERAVGYYVNINTPPVVIGKTVKINDLFLDVWIRPDFSYKVLDQDELQKAREQGVINERTYEKILKTKNEIIQLIQQKKLPDEFIKRYRID